MKKILFVGDAGSIHIKKYADYFLCNGYDVYLATFSGKNDTRVKNIFYLSDISINNDGGNFHYLLSVFKLVAIIKRIKPDFVNAHFSYSMGFITYIALKISRVKASFSVVCHGSDILDYPFGICKYLNKLVLKNADKIISVSWQMTEIIKKMNVNNEKIFTGQYGIEYVLKDMRHCVRDIDIISIRNYVPNSRIDELLKILNKHCFFEKKIVFVLPGIEEERLRYIQEKNKHIVFYKWLEHNQILELLERSNIYISATKSDGSSLSLMEALACGSIPIVSNIPSNREWIVDSLNGRLFDNFEDLFSIIKEISENVNKCNNIRAMNYRLIEERGKYLIQMEKIKKFIVE